MNEIQPYKEKKKTKKHSSFLKIYIHTGDTNVNIIPIPLWVARGLISVGLRVLKLVIHFKKDKPDDLTKENINEILKYSKTIIKELKQYPPFSILEIETHDTTIFIKTQ